MVSCVILLFLRAPNRQASISYQGNFIEMVHGRRKTIIYEIKTISFREWLELGMRGVEQSLERGPQMEPSQTWRHLLACQRLRFAVMSAQIGINENEMEDGG